MMRRRKDNSEITRIMTSAAVFLESYNNSIPSGFSKVSIKAMKEFQSVHPALFKHGNDWSIDRHRKRLMDWILTHQDAI